MTIHDVAKEAGVSKSTVSRYLNNGYVSDDNKIKIQAAIEKTGYQTNVFARGLKTNRSKLIAIIVPRLDSYTAIQSLNGMNSILSQLHYQMVVVPKNTIEEDEVTYLKRLSRQGFDGIIVVAHAITDDHVAIAQSSTTPIIFTGQHHAQTVCITIDDYRIGQKVAEYINTLKPESILYLSVSESDHAVGVLRKQGFLENVEAPVRTLITGFRQQDAFETMEKESPTLKYDLLLGATDNIAIGAIRYLHQQGIVIPDDKKVVGIGNYDLSHFITPTLTTLSIDYQALGKNAAHAILALLEDDYNYDYHAIEYHLIERRSSQSKK